MELVPNMFHLTWKSKELPDVGRVCVEKLKRNNPEWEIRLYDDADCRRVISEECNELLKVYDAYPTGIQRADFFRVIVVYLFGGFYLDIDFFLEKSINELRVLDVILAEEKTLTETECILLNQTYPLRIANYIFGGKARQLFYLDLILSMIDSSQSKIKTQEDILISTGPALLSKFYSDHFSEDSSITLIRNYKNVCHNNGCGRVSCHFGDFGVHLHHGTWRWKPGINIFRRTIKSSKISLNELLEIQFKFKSRKV